MSVTQVTKVTFKVEPVVSKTSLDCNHMFSVTMLLIPGTGNGERGTGNGERGTGNGERGTGNGERGTGNGERGTGNRSLGTNVQRQPACEFKMAVKTKERLVRNNLGKGEFPPAVPPDGLYVIVTAGSD